MISRRELFAAAAVSAAAVKLPAMQLNPNRQQPIRKALKVQPVLIYGLYKKREQTSWRPWGGLHNEQDVAQEKERIGRELKAMSAQAEFPLEVMPLEGATSAEQAAGLAQRGQDVTLMYGASGPLEALEALSGPGKWSVMFVRHRTGPAYLWYEIVHPRFLRKTVDEHAQTGMDPQDVVVDSHEEVLWRLRALGALKNTLGKKVVCVGGEGGWGAGGKTAPETARKLWKFELQTVNYDELGARMQRARQSGELVKRTQAEAEKYVKQKGVTLEAPREAVAKAFLLNEVFRDLLDEAKTDAITVRACMGTIMPVSETTACLPLTLLNDEGYLAFCESDFVVIPSGVLLHYISGKPVFLNNPTYPHGGVITQAHCTAPRRMDGKRDEPVRILTHYESDFGAAPKVEMRKGQVITNLIPDFASRRWIGLTGEIIENPFLDICRSQMDVRLRCDSERLAREMRGFHWMTCYGDYLKETGYALGKAGVRFLNLSQA